MTITLPDLLARREATRDELEAGDLHLLAVLRLPAAEMAAVPIGDVLCWAGGLGEPGVIDVLARAEMPWSERIGLLTARDVDNVCKQIKRHYPEVWADWRRNR